MPSPLIVGVLAVPKLHLTKLAIDRIKPTPGKQVDYHDTVARGLVLRVNWAGSKSWRVFFYERRRTRSIGLGRYGDESDGGIDLKTAREEAGRVRNRGYQKKLREQAEASQTTFKEAAEKWMRLKVTARKLVSEPKYRSTLDKTIYPELGDRPIEQIKRQEFARFLDKIDPDGNQPQKADDALGIIRRVCKHHEGQGNDYVSPINAQMRRVEQSETERDRFLSDAEIRALWKSCGQLGPFGGLCRTLLATGQRRTKVATMRWTDVDEDGVWDIHRAQREKYTAVAIKLPRLVTDVLKQQKRIDKNPFVFPASKAGKRKGTNPFYGSFSAFSQGKLALDELMHEELGEAPPSWTLHDLRRTARSLMSRAGVITDHADRLLGHQIKGVRRRYDRHDFFDEKAIALQKLADLLSSILSPGAGNVVRLPSKRSDVKTAKPKRRSPAA